MNLIIDRGMHPIFDRALGFTSFEEPTRQQAISKTDPSEQTTAAQRSILNDRRADLNPNDPNLQEHRRF